MESPLSPPPPRPPNARAWWEAAGSFREEQKGPADLSILLGWRLGHLEDDGNQPGLERVGSRLPTRDVLHVHRDEEEGLGPLGTARRDLGSPAGTGSPHLC